MLPLPVPASVYGLVLLLAALNFGFVKLDDVKEVGIYLTGIFPLLFVPAAAGVMELWAEMGNMLLPATACWQAAQLPHAAQGCGLAQWLSATAACRSVQCAVPEPSACTTSVACPAPPFAVAGTAATASCSVARISSKDRMMRRMEESF